MTDDASKPPVPPDFDEHDWRLVLAEGTEEAIQNYCLAHPNRQSREEISRALDEVRWSKAVKVGSSESYQEYLKLHPTGRHGSEATLAIDEAEWSTALKGGSTRSYEQYLKLHPKGKHEVEAKLALERLRLQQQLGEVESAAKAREQDDFDWQAAVQDGTVTTYESYLLHHSSGAHSEEAKVAIAVILRPLLLADLNNGSLRERYLSSRSNEARMDDMKRERMCWRAAAFALGVGLIAGPLLGHGVGWLIVHYHFSSTFIWTLLGMFAGLVICSSFSLLDQSRLSTMIRIGFMAIILPFAIGVFGWYVPGPSSWLYGTLGSSLLFGMIGLLFARVDMWNRQVNASKTGPLATSSDSVPARISGITVAVGIAVLAICIGVSTWRSAQVPTVESLFPIRGLLLEGNQTHFPVEKHRDNFFAIHTDSTVDIRDPDLFRTKQYANMMCGRNMWIDKRHDRKIVAFRTQGFPEEWREFGFAGRSYYGWTWLFHRLGWEYVERKGPRKLPHIEVTHGNVRMTLVFDVFGFEEKRGNPEWHLKYTDGLLEWIEFEFLSEK